MPVKDFDRVFNFNRYEDVIMELKEGSVVKITRNMESFWVTVTACEAHVGGAGPVHFKGNVNNKLICQPDGLTLGDKVEFDLSHIINVLGV